MAFGSDPLQVLPAIAAHSRAGGPRVKEIQTDRQPAACPKTLAGICPCSSKVAPPEGVYSSFSTTICDLLICLVRADMSPGSTFATWLVRSTQHKRVSG